MDTEWKEYVGNHTHLTTEEIFYKCQKRFRKIDKGENIAKGRGDEAFPLRHFVVCATCKRPLTASFSTGKMGNKFPYYRCYNKACTSRKTIAKKTLEDEFLGYLKVITPKKEFLDAFKGVILDVWKTKYKELNEGKSLLNKKLIKLEHEKAKILELKKKELLDDDEFKQEYSGVKQRILDCQVRLSESNLEEFDAKEVVPQCFDFISKIPEFYSSATYQQKVKVQSLIFTEKPLYNHSGFETPKLSLFFAQKKDFTHVKPHLVVPTGIEPVFSP
jgi:hypothetical protein